MIFLFKRKKIVIDCFTNNKAAHNLFNVEYATKFYPEWWKPIPSIIQREERGMQTPSPTIKNCPGIINYYKYGFMLPLWTDYLFEVGKINTDFLRVFPADPDSSSMQHPTFQRGTYLPPNKFAHIKLESPWFVRTNKKCNFIWLKPIWSFDDPNEFIQQPSVIEFYHQHATNVNIFLERKNETYKFILKAGTLMGHFVPLTENNIEIRNHYIPRSEFEDMKGNSNLRFSFDRSYIKYTKRVNKKRD